ncbi:MAG: serine/threonine protein kinase [Nitrospirae bacterium]|nr:serine/threonine protein kinase [Fimbriimonadaceae bacterium]
MFDPGQAIGEEIDGRYVLCEVLGEGSYGVVFSAEERSVGEAVGSVALKLMRPKSAAEREAVVREVRAMAGLSHPNLVAYRSSGEVGSGPLKGCLYLATELAEGSLADELLLKGKLPEEEVRALARDLASALEYLHSQQAVHRDVKPANVLRCGSVWKLADFGLVRGFSGTQVSASGSKGTALYMSPEAVQGQTGPHVDVWALGVVLQQAASGTLAYSGGSEAELIAGLLTREPAIAAGLPGWLEALVRTCLAKDRKDRSDAGALLRMTAAQSGAMAASPTFELPTNRSISPEFAALVANGRGIDPKWVTWEFLEGLEELDFVFSDLTDVDLSPLGGLNGLRKLRISNANLTDSHLVHLRALVGLEELVLQDNGLTDVGMSNLSNLTGLRQLDLAKNQISDVGLAHLKGLANLEWLDLSGNPISGDGLAWLSGLTHLKCLAISDANLTDACIGHLSQLRSLTSLDICRNPITDRGIRSLKESLTNLSSYGALRSGRI